MSKRKTPDIPEHLPSSVQDDTTYQVFKEFLENVTAGAVMGLATFAAAHYQIPMPTQQSILTPLAMHRRMAALRTLGVLSGVSACTYRSRNRLCCRSRQAPPTHPPVQLSSIRIDGADEKKDTPVQQKALQYVQTVCGGDLLFDRLNWEPKFRLYMGEQKDANIIQKRCKYFTMLMHNKALFLEHPVVPSAIPRIVIGQKGTFEIRIKQQPEIIRVDDLALTDITYKNFIEYLDTKGIKSVLIRKYDGANNVE